jgi:hypothetical protein
MTENDSIYLLISGGALIISIVALIYTVKTFILKSGLKIRCNLTTCSTVDCNDIFISSITLENIKDRATVIFKIYLRLARNVYIEIEDFSSKPLILKPFEVYYKEYDPILFYSSGDNFVKIDHLIDNKKIKRNIVLSTTDGEYKIRTYISYWDAIYTSLKNFYTIAALPQRLDYKNKSYGSNIKYLIDLKYNDREEQVIPINKIKEKVFVNVDFTDTSLKSSVNLRRFMLKQKRDGKLSFTDIKVIDYEGAIEKKKEFYKKDPYIAETCGYFMYTVIGKIVTLIEDFKLKRKNKQIQKKKQNR